jgi:multiple sugar transport system permease protein
MSTDTSTVERLPGTATSQSARARRTPMTDREKRNLKLGLAFIAPWALGFVAFVVYPIVYSFILSLTKYTGLAKPTFIGFDNYTRMVRDPLAQQATKNTLFYAGLAVPIGLVIAVVLALAMNAKVREVALYRTALYLPSLVPIFALSFIFIVLVNPQFGLFNRFLGVLGFANTDLLGAPLTAKLVIVAMAQLGAGNAALIFLAGLNTIPESLYEAARIDGAGTFARFFRITLPLLSPAILFNLITGISAGLQVFAQAYIMTNGGPNNGTLFYMYYLYKTAFSYAQLGYASALAIGLFLVGLVLAVVVYSVSRRFVNYDVAAG